MKLEELFTLLEAETVVSGTSGTLQRRIPTRSPCDLFVGVEKPTNARVFRARFSRELVDLPTETFRLKGVEMVSSDTFEDGRDCVTVRLRLLNSAFGDLFTNLAEDIEQHVAAMPDERAAATAFVDRIKKWRRFLESHAPDGLGPEEQRGLYGELRFLEQYVLPYLPHSKSIAAWTGPDSTAKDFQFAGGTACEIKTTASKAPYAIQINSEKQLDTYALSALYLSCLFIDEAHGTGTTLAEMVEKIRNVLSANYEAQQLFEDKLQQSGYLELHAARYRIVGYVDRAVSNYNVVEGFPRLITSDLPAGVGHVLYSISLDACKPYIVEIDTLISSIKEPQ